MSIHTISKHTIKLGPNELILPLGYRVCHFNFSDVVSVGSLKAASRFNLWSEARPLEERVVMVVAKFMVIDSGQSFDDESWSVAKSYAEGSLCYHLLEEVKFPESVNVYPDRQETPTSAWRLS